MLRTDAPHRSTILTLAVGLMVLILTPPSVRPLSDPTQATTSVTQPQVTPSASLTYTVAVTGTLPLETASLPAPTTSLQASDTPATASASQPSTTASATPSFTASPSPSFEPPLTASPSSSAAPSATPLLESLTPVLTATASQTSTATEIPTSAPTALPVPPGTILINEVAWAGTLASASDEWIELFNPGSESVNLAGWTLDDGDDLHISLSGSLPPYAYYLLERTDDSTVADVSADQVYTGNLHNGGEALWLRDPSGAVVDSANQPGGAWPAGDSSRRASMERIGGGDLPGDWSTWNGLGAVAHDADGHLIHGTPRSANSMYYPTPTSAAPTPTGSLMPTGSGTPSPQPTSFPAGTILINEVAWMGTRASSSDEWIELMNTTGEAIDLNGWVLSDGGDVQIILTGLIGAHGYYLLERSDDSTVADVPAHMIYGGTLSNNGERLRLLDPAGQQIDSANQDGGGWPSGDSSLRFSMERRGGDDSPGDWSTYTGYGGTAHDAAGGLIGGTPGQPNSLFFPTPSPTWIPGRVVINEVLIRPHYDWEGAGGGTTSDEFIELINTGPYAVNLEGWILDDVPEAGSRPYVLPGFTLPPNGILVLFRSRTHIALNDSGDTVRLMAPSGMLVDKVRYLRVRAYNLSFGRLPDGSNQWRYGLWPTPGRPNLVFIDPSTLPPPSVYDACPPHPGLHLIVLLAGRYPSVEGWFGQDGHLCCPRHDPPVQQRAWGALSRIVPYEGR
ncbi:MAG: lamin tail domain-containing protein [Anaerolineales bacterium]